MRVVISGGGTAGHVNPALAVAAELVAERDDVLFVGTPDGLEATLVPRAGLDFVGLPAHGFDRARPITALTAALSVTASAIRALRVLHGFRPDVVVGFGAFVSVPVGLAAWLLRIPLVIHEQNSVPGLANRFLSRLAVAACITYRESASRFARTRSVLTGNPVRREVLDADAARGRRSLGVAENDVVLLVFGGSRGARHLNQAVLAASDRLLEIADISVVHVAGPLEAQAVQEGVPDNARRRWQVHPYLDDMGDVLAASDLVIARAGATSIAEITVLGKPAVLVPYPYATDDHQTMNAASLLSAGAAVLVKDEELDDDAFTSTVTGLLRDPDRRASMAGASAALGHRDAASAVAAVVRSAARGRSIR
jgi:UDP-N-acetylglucosamine--N-acetylmuramyl-(pentapeptide) pyrophosphoryl-undecaprenol N-acetylglucosamine transferase